MKTATESFTLFSLYYKELFKISNTGLAKNQSNKLLTPEAWQKLKAFSDDSVDFVKFVIQQNDAAENNAEKQSLLVYSANSMIVRYQQ